MPVSLEQWRASVGSNNAARSHVLAKCTGKKSPKGLFGQFLLFLLVGVVSQQAYIKGCLESVE